MAYNPMTGSTIGRHLYTKGFMDCIEIVHKVLNAESSVAAKQMLDELQKQVSRELDSLTVATELL